jgi:hypothetical protein
LEQVAQERLQITPTAQQELILYLPQLLQLAAELELPDQQVKLLVVLVVHPAAVLVVVLVGLEQQVRCKDLPVQVQRVVLQVAAAVELVR